MALPLALLETAPRALIVVVDGNPDRAKRLLAAVAAAAPGGDAGGVGGEGAAGSRRSARLLQLRQPFTLVELEAAHELGSLVDCQLIGSLFGTLQQK